MAELTDPAAASCCAPSTQESCCAPSDKSTCCGTAAAGGSCGCTASGEDTREAVRARYAAAALATTDPTRDAGGCSGGGLITDEQAALVGSGLYGDEQHELPDTAGLAPPRCGHPPPE